MGVIGSTFQSHCEIITLFKWKVEILYIRDCMCTAQIQICVAMEK